ncbi:hypothetical protein CBER1_08329 [Cercospora berteroae]|uniref:BTB domain-containing protein n=1 Tax=Cercospora berteroae TaxID=357750 RepID=A0A2S6CJL6_9PEZI|nr:hypothetical protein CBER1_08329 [Cercospora berteroae]
MTNKSRRNAGAWQLLESTRQQALTLPRYTCAIITVAVGTNESPDEFRVHEDLLREHSDFFEAALNNQWKEAQERKITLPEDEPDVVDTYVQWLYGSTIEAAAPSAMQIEGRITNRIWAKLYVFGDKIQDRVFANAVMEAWTAALDSPPPGAIRTFPDIRCILTIYQHTTPGNPARKFLVHVWAAYRKLRWMEEGRHKNSLLECPEFLLDLARATAPKVDEPYRDLYPMHGQWLYEI